MVHRRRSTFSLSRFSARRVTWSSFSETACGAVSWSAGLPAPVAAYPSILLFSGVVSVDVLRGVTSEDMLDGAMMKETSDYCVVIVANEISANMQR